MRQLSVEAAQANEQLRVAAVEVLKLRDEVAGIREQGDARVLADISVFDVTWGDESMPVGSMVWIAVSVLPLVLSVWFGYGYATILAGLVVVAVTWWFWPAPVARRIKFDGHYEYDHADLRPDVISTKVASHKALYGWVLYTHQTDLGKTVDRLLVSYEVLAQLCTPDIMRVDRKPEVAEAAIFSAVARMPSVNYSRFLTLAGHDVMRNTALVAYAKFIEMTTQVRRLDFGLSLAASQ